MSEAIFERGIWCFWLTADEGVLRYVAHLSCVLSISYPGRQFFRRPMRALVEINPRYNHEEAWAWMQGVLEGETQVIELEAAWESAIETAFEVGDEG